MSLEDGGAADGQQKERSEQENRSPHQHPPDIDEQDKVQANASSVKQSAIPSEGERSGVGQEEEATLETPTQRKSDVKRSSKKRQRDAESKEGSAKKSKGTHEKS